MTDKEEIQTEEERLNWLRERGVLIETSEERKAKQNSVSTSDNDPNAKKISFVYIPSDTSKPMKEMNFSLKHQSQPVDALPEVLKPMFSVLGKVGDSVDLSMLRDQQQQHFASGNAPSVTISDETLRKVAQEGHVETFNLVKPVPRNKFTSVNIYLDEIGMMKRLPLNARAADLAKKAGFNPPPNIYGDVFIGRVQSSPNKKTTNLDFKLGSDTSHDATWLQNAAMENLEFQNAMNGNNNQQQRVQPTNAGEDGKAKQEEGYSWTQTDEEVEVVVDLKSDEITTKDIKVNFRPKSLELLVKKDPVVYISLFDAVDPDGCTWTIEKSKGTKQIAITCEKQDAISWPRITF